MPFSDRLVAAMKAAGMRRDDLASAVGVSGPAVSQWRSGSREPDLNTVRRIAQAIGVRVEQLLEEEPPREITQADIPPPGVIGPAIGAYCKSRVPPLSSSWVAGNLFKTLEQYNEMLSKPLSIEDFQSICLVLGISERRLIEFTKQNPQPRPRGKLELVKKVVGGTTSVEVPNELLEVVLGIIAAWRTKEKPRTITFRPRQKEGTDDSTD